MDKKVQLNTQTQPQGTVTATPATGPEAASNTCSSVEPEVISDGTTLAIISRSCIYQERLRQARASFNLAFGLTAVSAIIGLAGVLLLFSGNGPAAKAMAAGGATSGAISASWLKLAKDANDRLDKTAKVLEDKS